jgi:hypothetical protein
MHTATDRVRHIDAVTVYGKGGTSANKFYKSLSYLYPFYRDSVTIDWEGVAVLESIRQYGEGLIDFIMVDSKFTEDMTEKGFYGLPMVGSALVMVYNLPSLHNTTLVPLLPPITAPRLDTSVTMSRVVRSLHHTSQWAASWPDLEKEKTKFLRFRKHNL